MKKEYIKPEMKAIMIQNQQILAASDGPRMSGNGDIERPEGWEFD